MPKCQQKNCSNDLALFFSLLGAQFSTKFLDILHLTSQDVFNYSCEISRDFNSKVFHKALNKSKQPNIGTVFWVTVFVIEFDLSRYPLFVISLIHISAEIPTYNNEPLILPSTGPPVPVCPSHAEEHEDNQEIPSPHNNAGGPLGPDRESDPSDDRPDGVTSTLVSVGWNDDTSLRW